MALFSGDLCQKLTVVGEEVLLRRSLGGPEDKLGRFQAQAGLSSDVPELADLDGLSYRSVA